MNLADLTDILDHLEANGNVPAGWWHCKSGCGTPDGGIWKFHQQVSADIDRLPPHYVGIATASLCHTIEGVLMREGWRPRWVGDGYVWQHDEHMATGAADRRAAAAAAYRAHYQLSINSVDIDRQEPKPCP